MSPAAKWAIAGCVGIHAKYVLPRFIDLSMRNKETARVRADWVPHACGDVLEVGIGSGLNLPFYSGQVRRVYGVEPSPELQKLARKRVAGQGIEVNFLSQSAEEMLPLAEQSVDTVLITWTLCSIPAVQSTSADEESPQARREANFVEHGRSPDAGVAAWQDRLTPAWKHIGGGCHLNREIDALVTKAGFAIDELKTCYLPGPRPMTYTYQGFAHV